MALKQTIEAYELLDSATVTGETVAAVLRERGLQVEVIPVQGHKGGVDSKIGQQSVEVQHWYGCRGVVERLSGGFL